MAPQEPDPAAEGVERTARLRAGRKNSVPPATSSSQKHPRKLSQEPPTTSEVGPGIATKSSKPPRFSMKDMKKRKARSGTWSKELIHKIVQQKNKLHKLQVKSSKQAQLPQATERPLAATKEGRLREYDYVSDSDEEGAECSKPRGRKKRGTGFLGRSKYSFSKKRLGEVREPERKTQPGATAGKGTVRKGRHRRRGVSRVRRMLRRRIVLSEPEGGAATHLLAATTACPERWAQAHPVLVGLVTRVAPRGGGARAAQPLCQGLPSALPRTAAQRRARRAKRTLPGGAGDLAQPNLC